MIEPINGNASLSSFQPSTEVAEFTRIVKLDAENGDRILRRSWTELNERSVIQDRERGVRTFNAFVDESIEDPATAWQWRGTRSKARNKAIQMHAHLTAGYIIPLFSAQNEADEEDTDFSDMMHDCADWLVNNSNYKSSFLAVSMGMLTNPVTYLGAEWHEVSQTIKEKTDKGLTKKEVLDEVLSGFNAPVYSTDQILISNAHEQNIQRQRSLIKRRYVDYGEAKAKYGNHENFQYVRRGVHSVYDSESGAFYDIKDSGHPGLVEEFIYYNRREDTEVCFLSGIYMGDSDVNANPFRHRDERNTPMYDLTPFGYQRIDEHFFFYKSLMNSQYWDNALLDEQYRIGMNRAFLDANMPVAISGSDKLDTSIVFPSAVTTFKDPNTKVTPLLPQSNLGNLFQAMQITEQSMDEASISATAGGQLPDPNTTATAVNAAQQNAETMLGGVGKTLAESISQYGLLMKNIVVHHLTAPVVDEIVGPNVRLKYRTLMLKDKIIDGKSVSKVIRFDDSFLGTQMTEDEMRDKSLELLTEVKYPNNKKHIYLINPELISRFRYLCRVDPQRMFPENDQYRQAMLSGFYAQFNMNPFIDLESLTRKVTHAYFRGESEDIIKKQDATAGLATGAMPPQPAQMPVASAQAMNTATVPAPGMA